MKNKVTCSKFGTLSNGKKAHIFKAERDGIFFCVTDYGCAITSLNIRNSDGTFTDVVLGFDTFTSYATSWGSFGAIIGRFANKIKGAGFTLDKKKYQLFENFENCTLHGGNPSWGNILWNAKKIKNEDSSGVLFYNDFPEGHQGFPGNLHVEIEYLIDDEKQIKMTYTAETDAKTPVSITNHSYFNLDGLTKGDGRIHDYKLKLYCKEYIETDEKNFPTGKILSVKDTQNDFTRTRKIMTDTMESPHYDVCFVTPCYEKKTKKSQKQGDEPRGIPLEGKPIEKIAELTSPESGHTMEVFTNQEGVQLYTAKYLKFEPGKMGIRYMPYSAVCLETQSFPDSPNQKSFPSTILNPGEKYQAITIYRFSEF